MEETVVSRAIPIPGTTSAGPRQVKGGSPAPGPLMKSVAQGLTSFSMEGPRHVPPGGQQTPQPSPQAALLSPAKHKEQGGHLPTAPRPEPNRHPGPK